LLADETDMRDIVEEFVAALPERVQQLRDAYARFDWAELRTLAHRLKGAGGSYGYPAISQLASEMEREFLAQSTDNFLEWSYELEELAAAARRGLLG